MHLSNPVQWLALQRFFVSKPKKGLECLKSGNFSGLSLPIEQAKKDFERVQKLGLHLITYESDDYPKILKEIYDPPLVLLAKGAWPKWEEWPWVAVVGARKATEWGKNKTREIVEGLVAEGVGIVSGLAYGIDSQAHKVALEAGGITWGVLGSGPDVLYPQRNAPLAEKMTKRGGYLSEFPLGTPPYASQFPQRNRIISGLSGAVIIVEATLKSGSLITGRFALEQGREVFVITPPEEHVAYEGNKKLLEEGATPYGGEQGPGTVDRGLIPGPQSMVHGPEQSLLVYLKSPRPLDYLVQKTHRKTNELLAALVLLESEGLVKKIPGPLWQSL